jgi:uncharacterized sporulation protein YeaH/YhbH (DUF444 family)
VSTAPARNAPRPAVDLVEGNHDGEAGDGQQHVEEAVRAGQEAHAKERAGQEGPAGPAAGDGEHDRKQRSRQQKLRGDLGRRDLRLPDLHHRHDQECAAERCGRGAGGSPGRDDEGAHRADGQHRMEVEQRPGATQVMGGRQQR